MRAKSSITVNRPPDEVYAQWRDLTKLPTFMYHLESVTDLGGGRSEWTAKGPLGTDVTWEAEIVEEREPEIIAWRSVEGADVANTGYVAFLEAPAGQGTEVTVELDYDAPGGAVGALIAKVLGEEPTQQLKDELRRFKQIIETGEVVRSDGAPDGTSAVDLRTQEDARPNEREGASA